MANLTFDGNVKVSFVSTLTSTTSPSAAELTAGTSLESHITPDGLATPFDTAEVDQSSLGSTFTNKTAGRREPNLSITFKTLTSAGVATAAATTLIYRAEGYLVVRRHKAASAAFAAADVVDVYPVQVGQPSPANAAPNEVQKATVTLFCTADPSLGVTAAA